MKQHLLSASIALTLLSSCGDQQKPTEEQHENHPGMSKGKTIFINNCATCHKLNEKTIGPALSGVMTKWDNDTTRIGMFIKSSQESIHNGDKRAKEVYEEYNETIMPSMPQLTDNDINELIDYMNKGVE